MSKIKYKFNPDNLSYEEIVVTGKQRVLRFFKNVLILFSISCLIVFVFSFFFDTPAEKYQKRENKELLAQYNILNQKLKTLEQSMDEIQKHDNNIYRLIFGIDPMTDDQKQGGHGGVDPYKDLSELSNSELLVETASKIDGLTHKIVTQTESYSEVMKMIQEKEQYLKSIPAISPISDKNLTRFASGFGYRIHPIYRTLKMHNGIDLTAPVGTQVHATGDGVVVSAGFSSGGYGKKVIIDHGFGYKTLYAHLNDTYVKVGKKVKRGDIIGEVGNTGRSTAPHLHYEVRKNDKTENPVNYYYADLTPEEYDEMINASSQMTMSFD
ncbi:MAG: peptidoglycan DD-metalloendopeptidase family protein [Salinivirgaceae bacterium]|nr:peptidoglycan DD-metalloendopeptidase family protein [Salinivirgaceae bacterium]